MAHEQRRRQLPTRESLDSSGEDQLRAELRQRLPPGGGATRPPPSQQAADTSGSVTVSVDARGRVTDVEISQVWRNRLGKDALAGAVFEAYTAARQRAGEAFALAIIAAEEAGVDPPSPAEEMAEPEPPRPEDTEEWLVWIRERFARIREKADRTAAALSAVQRAYTGPHGFLTATLDGSGVAGIVGDAGRIWYADRSQLREDAFAVLAAADRPLTGPGS